MRMQCFLFAAALIAIASGLMPGMAAAEPVGTAFTYQGQLKQEGRPVNGPTDLRFSLWNAFEGGIRIGPILSSAVIEVTNGLLAEDLDFGPTAFDGQARWLQIEVRHPAGVGAYVLITPRQALTPMPYAIRALNVANGHALDAADGSPTNSVFVNNDGNVGIKTTAAETALTVQAYATDALRLLGPGPYTSTARLHFGDGDYVYLAEDDDDSLTIHSFDRTAMMGGNVGVGTANPSHRLTVQSGNVATMRLIGPQGGGLGFGARLAFGDFNAGNNSYYAYLEEDLDDSLNLYSRVRTSIMGGNVGIGTFTPEAKLDVNAALTAAIGVYARSHSGGLSGPAIRAHNSHSGGIAIFATTNSSDANLVVTNEGTGDLIRGFSGAGGSNLAFRVENNGKTTVSVLTITGGSDLAEPFIVGSHEATTPRRHEEIEPGTVVVIDPANPGALKVSNAPYDRKVAGIISGAKGLSPGMVMKAEGQPHADGDHPVALTGRVWCKCDSSSGAIEPGDLLTTSSRPGHAMKVKDYGKAQGAILGKAMSPLSDGTGLVLVLVSLQ